MSAFSRGSDPTHRGGAAPPFSDTDRLHARAIDAWIAETGLAKLPPAAASSLFEAATAAVWARAKSTLGQVTLAAIAERVAHAASRKDELLAAVAVDENGFDFRLLADAATDSPPEARLAAQRLLLLELLTVLGRLTAEILTPALHAEIARIRSVSAPPRESR